MSWGVFMIGQLYPGLREAGARRTLGRFGGMSAASVGHVNSPWSPEGGAAAKCGRTGGRPPPPSSSFSAQRAALSATDTKRPSPADYGEDPDRPATPAGASGRSAGARHP